jgi:hypothetical protein
VFLQARFVERFAMGSPFSGGTINGPPFSCLSEKVSWVEKFVQVPASSSHLDIYATHPFSFLVTLLKYNLRHFFLYISALEREMPASQCACVTATSSRCLWVH